MNMNPNTMPKAFESEFPKAGEILSSICANRQAKKLEYRYVKPIDLDNLPVFVGVRIGRNDLCPCGSGKKYKKCCIMS